MNALATGIGIAAFSALLTVLVVRFILAYALKHSMLDHPDERRTHAQSTPRGAGISFLLPIAGVGLVCLGLHLLQVSVFTAWLLPALALSAIGWIDDHRPLSVRVRFLVQSIAVVALFILLGAPENFGLSLLDMAPTWLRLAWSALCVLWLVNIFNFMDGIDGFAATQSLLTALGGGVLLALSGQQGLSFMCLAMAGTCLGFLVWNWAPARIFMGDSGSYALGLFFGFVAIAGQKSEQAVPLVLWAMLMAPFIWDASCTLLLRIRRERSWLSAHRDHAFQLLHARGMSHAGISSRLVLLNLLMVWPLVALAWWRPNLQLWVFLAQGLIMLALWVFIRRPHTMELST